MIFKSETRRLWGLREVKASESIREDYLSKVIEFNPQPFGRRLIEEAPSTRTSQTNKIAVTLKCPEGWKAVTVRFDNTRCKNNFPCNVL